MRWPPTIPRALAGAIAGTLLAGIAVVWVAEPDQPADVVAERSVATTTTLVPPTSTTSTTSTTIPVVTTTVPAPVRPSQPTRPPAPAPVEQRQIYVLQGEGIGAMRSDGTQRRLVVEGYFETPDASADGSWLVAVYGVEHRLATIDSRSGALQVIAEGVWQSPRISPDGRQIAAIHQVEGRGFDLVLMNRDGTGQRVIRPPEPWTRPNQVEWAPDGRRLALTDGSGMLLAVYDLVTGAAHNIRPGGGQVSYPRWSPDGSQIAFNNGKDLIVIPAAGGADRVLTGGTNEWPRVLTWDGNDQLLFSAGTTLFRIGADGQGLGEVAGGYFSPTT